MATENEVLDGFAVQFMALADRKTVVLTAVGPNLTDEPASFGTSRLISYNVDLDTWGRAHYEFGAWWHVGAGLTSDGKRKALFGTNRRTTIFNYDDGPNGDEPGRLKSPATVRDIALIGNHFYVCGGNEFLGRRDGPGEWTYLSLAASPKEARFSFDQMIGNAPDNIYLLQSQQPFHLCHWNGETMRQLPPLIPDDMLHEDRSFFLPKSMVFAPDGQLFIGGANGELLVGTAETGFLPLLYPEMTGKGSPRAIKGLAWYDGSLWAARDEILRLVDGEWQVQQVLVDQSPGFGFDRIYACDGALLVGSQFKAVLFDGMNWRRIFGSLDTDQWLQLRMLEQQHDDMAELLESARALRDIIRAQP